MLSQCPIYLGTLHGYLDMQVVRTASVFKRSPLLPNDGKCQSKSPTYSFTWSPMMSFGWWSVWVFYQVTACHCHAPSRVLTLSDHRGGRRIAGRKLAGGIVTAIWWHTRQTQGWDSIPGTELQSNKKRSNSRNLWNKYTNRSCVTQMWNTDI